MDRRVHVLVAMLAKAALVSLVAGSARATVPPPSAGAVLDIPAYDVRVRVDPAKGALECRVEILSPGTSTFALGPDLAIRRVLADGRETPFTQAPSADGGGSRDVTVETPAEPSRLVVEYGGVVRDGSRPPVMSQVNHVRADHVELASYAAWYPRLAGSRPFTFRLTVDVPEAFGVVTNGDTAGEVSRGGGRAVVTWESREPAFDLVVVAAPGLRSSATVAGAASSVEVWSAALPQDYVDAMARDVARAVQLVADLVGAPPPSRVVRLVYSPRPGWGYVRRPLVVVSEAGAIDERASRFGPARDLRYVAHEIAHYWWHFGDASTPEDWINEGLAEYSAFAVSEPLAGREFAAQLRQDYEQRSADAATTSAIAETANGSPDREVNRYARPVLMLDAAQARYGSERVRAFLRALYRRFAAEGRATTATFLDEAGLRLGSDARTAFSEMLYRKDWSDASRPEYAHSARDAVFLGTWYGTLAQGGETLEVVLHLVLRDGALVATLDSPGQKVAGIPVPMVRIDGAVLTFGLGSVGVRYRGTLGADGAVAGDWTQGGATSRLVLTKTPPPSTPPLRRAPGGGTSRPSTSADRRGTRRGAAP
jgi:hypothetical protein